MKFEVHHTCRDYNSYRAARVKSLFNAEQGYAFDLIADIEFPEEWQLGVLVGTSGSGKTSLGQEIFGKDKMIDLDAGWDSGKPDNRRHSGRL